MRVLVTGSAGFLGRNLSAALRRREGVEILAFDREQDPGELDALLEKADFVFHLAGANRPPREEDFGEVNVDLTARLCVRLAARDAVVPVVFSSSRQAELDNPYGRSKRAAELLLRAHALAARAPVHVFRLHNLFGKWGRPDYNSVVATFCHRSARGLPLRVDDPATPLALNHVDDVVAAFLALLDHHFVIPAKAGTPSPTSFLSVEPVYHTTVGELRERLEGYAALRAAFTVPDFGDALDAVLHPTWLSYLPEEDFARAPELREDARGRLCELFKSPGCGQVFVSTTRPGLTRGNHYHDRKVEKFCVLRGRALIRFRLADGDEVLDYPVDGDRPRVVDIPPGYTHSITNTGDEEMICLFWSSQIHDPAAPDTHALRVLKP